jgi:excisionase family DNA binding protein
MTSLDTIPLVLNKNDVAELLRISERQVDKLRRAGILPAFKIGGGVKFHKADVINMIPARRA